MHHASDRTNRRSFLKFREIPRQRANSAAGRKLWALIMILQDNV